ncbi:MAG TPA: HPr family phosphocarrier protein [Xanthomonadales bacterium]|nr:HPr family phosphocarrier protein [Xanthomonadales bacterium]
MLQREVTIGNKLGLHARAASKLVNCATSFAADVWLRRGEREINGKSIMGVLTLAAGKGTVLGIRTQGEDEQQALQELIQLFEDRFGEDE